MKRDMSKKAVQERKVERAIEDSLSKLQVLTRIYIGERAIKRGDTIPHEEVWKKFKKKYAFKLTAKTKASIAKDLFEETQTNNPQLLNYVIRLIELRDELFKRPMPKKFPSPFSNHL